MSWTTLADERRELDLAEVVTSPASITSPVVVSVSQATREPGSWASMASSTASEIWSHILSGWPIETDSDVKRERVAIEFSWIARRGALKWVAGCRAKGTLAAGRGP